MARQTALPVSLRPRLINREAAAAYISVSPNMFDQLVETGSMPPAKLLGGRRKAWDVEALDRCVDLLPADAAGAKDDTWSDVHAS